MSDYIRLPRSALSEELWLDGNLARLFIYLASKTNEKGEATVDSTELCKIYGWSRQQSRTLIKRLKSTANLTALPTAKSTTLVFENQEYKPKQQPQHQPHEQPHPQPQKRPKKESVIQCGTLDIKMPVYDFVDPAFEEVFTAWLEYKKEQFNFVYKGKRSLKSVYDKLVALSGFNPEIAMQVVNQSMSAGWKGLFELKDNGTSKIPIEDKYATRRGTNVGDRSSDDYGGPF